MKFTIMSGDLQEEVGWVSHALPKRAAAPVLNGILIEGGDGEIALAAFDYDTSRRATIEVAVDPGKILVPGRLLADIVKAFPKNELVDVAADDREVELRCGKAVYVLPLLPVEDFPNLPKPPPVVGTVDAEALQTAVAHVAPSAGTDEKTLPMLTCVRVQSGEDGCLDLAATDRYRVVWRPLTWAPVLDAPAELAAMIPAKILTDIVRGLPSGPVEVALDKGLACFTIAGRASTVRLYDEDFIKFKRFAEEVKAVHTVEVDAAELAKVVKRISLLAERLTPVRLSFSQGGVLVEAGSSDGGRGSELVDCGLDGDDIMVAFQPHFLLDGLNAVGGTAKFEIQAATQAVLLTGTGDPSLKYVVLPIRLSA